MQGYLKNGYNRATAEMMVREFLGMRVEIYLLVNISQLSYLKTP